MSGTATDSAPASWDDAAAELASLRTLWPKEVPHQAPDPAAGPGLAETLSHWAATRPDSTAMSYYGWTSSWAQLERDVASTAGWLAGRGVRKGSRVGVFMGNCPQFVQAFLAIAWLGAVYVPVNPMYRTEELRHQLADSGASHLIAHPQSRSLVEAALSQIDDTIDVTWTDPAAVFAAPTSNAVSDDASKPAVTSSEDLPHPVPAPEEAGDWERVLASEPLESVPADPDRLASLNYTGGTTGLPKGCEHTLGHLAYTAVSAMAGLATAPGRDRTVCLGFLPMFWVAGENFGLLLPIYAGGEVAIMARWHPQAALRTIADRGVTQIVSPADGYVELIDLLKTDEFVDTDLSSLEVCQAVSFVRKLDTELRSQWREATGTILREASYGMTETHTSDSFTLGLQGGDRDLQAEPVYCGFPVPGTDIVIVDIDLNPVPVGEIGEILVRSPSVTTGYWKNAKATADTLIDGWLRTGDTGRFDDQGALTYLARTKEMIKVNGMSVFPAEVESLLRSHPGIDTVAVAPRDDVDRGQVPVAFITTTEGADVDRGSLTAWAKENMAVYKIPEFVIVDGMPMTATGKIRKTVLLEELLEGDQ
ncbi:long-chain acyl-CoA synthetase [Brevibacterium iodinum ATCC 49514]|uniref:Long-chain acyl-CoA synthetase n=1 Tax=Brevibacterium iodinum ATCC 49514 TaxID=1255616 RepID=A0A2H1J883_9MICO|nr:AMP-binding protein [Brevibacterium iodinum]SMX83584.1 long-chain acyl-CoA synthetase [Brevibacterium iodinum ATCC 49514]SUW11174.1 Long-chain-fatty-acid--CoA ligase [Brevibacterium iodinum]